jgi:hypothetical protein
MRRGCGRHVQLGRAGAKGSRVGGPALAGLRARPDDGGSSQPRFGCTFRFRFAATGVRGANMGSHDRANWLRLLSTAARRAAGGLAGRTTRALDVRAVKIGRAGPMEEARGARHHCTRRLLDGLAEMGLGVAEMTDGATERARCAGAARQRGAAPGRFAAANAALEAALQLHLATRAIVRRLIAGAIGGAAAGRTGILRDGRACQDHREQKGPQAKRNLSPGQVYRPGRAALPTCLRHPLST